jgi:PEGA domain
MRMKFGSRTSTRRIVALALMGLGASSMAGCDSVKKLRAFFHPPDPSAEGQGRAKLRLDIEPSTGLTLLLDGVQVGTASPYEGQGLAPGQRVLEIRAAGYHTLLLPITLTNDQLVKVPIALRRQMEPMQPVGMPKPPEPETPAPPPPESPAPPVPAGVKPVALRINGEPQQSASIDGGRQDGRRWVVERVTGQVTFGPVVLAYRLGSQGLFELTVPKDGAIWTKDANPIAPGAAFALNRTPVRLERVDATGAKQAVVLRRVPYAPPGADGQPGTPGAPGAPNQPSGAAVGAPGTPAPEAPAPSGAGTPKSSTATPKVVPTPKGTNTGAPQGAQQKAGTKRAPQPSQAPAPPGTPAPTKAPE